jgi:hypothetical protein
VKRLADPDPIVRWATARALGRIDGTPVPNVIFRVCCAQSAMMT